MRRIGTVFFDIDQTLYDLKSAHDQAVRFIMDELESLFDGRSYPSVCEAFSQANRAALGEEVSDESVAMFRRRRSELFLRQLCLPEENAPLITELDVSRRSDMDAPVAGAKEVIRSLISRYQLGIVSNGVREVQHQKLEALGIEKCFRCIVISEDVGFEKPDPSIFRYAASLLAVQPETCLHVGDDFEKDIVGALGCGMLACWFCSEKVASPISELGPNAQISKLEELPHVLENLD